MSLSDARRILHWDVVMEALADAGLDDSTVEMVKHARAVEETVMSMTKILLGATDGKAAKNYVKVEMVGLIPPFDRVYVELIRPGGRTSHDLRELLRDRLSLVRRLLADGDPDDAIRKGIIQGIDEDLATEAP